MSDLGKAYVQIIPKAEGISNKIKDQVAPGAKQAGSEAGTSIAGNIKKVLAGAAIGATVVKGFQAALNEGGKLQQSFGGLETLYGDAADAAKNYAMQAAQAGISANDYAEQAVSFGASLKAAFGGDTAKAAEAANTAIMDMTDNAAKMGTPLENIQNAYQGFAKGNYTMLDNLKLGYGGTKTEMERLLADASKLSGVEYNMDNLGDVYSAIHVIQEDLGLTGVAAQEAATTFSGSFGAMKASAENLLANLTTGGDVAGSMRQLAQSVVTFIGGNLVPMIKDALKGIPALFDGIWQAAFGYPIDGDLSSFLDGIIDLLYGAIPKLLETGTNMALSVGQGVLNAIPTVLTAGAEIYKMLGELAVQNVPKLMETVYTRITETIPTLQKKGEEIVTGLRDSITTNAPILWEKATALVSDFAGKITEAVPTLIDKGAEFISTIIAGITAYIPNLATSASEIISSIGNYLSENIPTLGEKVGEFASTLGEHIVQNIPVIVGAIIRALPVVASAIGRIGLTILQALAKLIPSVLKAGINILSGLARGLGGGALGLIRSAMARIKSALEEPIQNAKDTINGVIEGIKGFFPLSIGNIFSNFNLPHIHVSGGSPPFGIAGKGSLPSFSVDWYEKAMEQPYMFNRPSLIGVGEAGDEMVYGRRALMEDIRQASGGARNVTVNVTVNGADSPEQWANRLVREFVLQARTA